MKINLSFSNSWARLRFPVSLCGVNDEHHEEKLHRDIFTIETPVRSAENQRHERTTNTDGPHTLRDLIKVPDVFINPLSWKQYNPFKKIRSARFLGDTNEIKSRWFT